MHKTIVGIFNNSTNAENAIKELKSIGYSGDDISIVAQETDEVREMRNRNTVGDVAGGAASGAVTGAGLGALAGLLIGAGALAIPGAGALLIGGPLAAALGLTGAAATTVSGAVTGGVAGGLIGGLVSFGLSQADAEMYAQRINSGNIMLAAKTRDGDEQTPQNIFNANGAEEVRIIGASNV